MPFAATWMDLERVMLSEASQTEKPRDITCTQNLKHDTNEFIYETETDSQTQRTNLWLPGARGGRGGMDQGFGLGLYRYNIQIDRQIIYRYIDFGLGLYRYNRYI